MSFLVHLKGEILRWPPRAWVAGFVFGIIAFALTTFSFFIGLFFGSTFLNIIFYNKFNIDSEIAFWVMKPIIMGIIWSVLFHLLFSRNIFKGINSG